MSKQKLPPKVHVKNGRYYWVDKNRWHGLSRLDEGMRELHRRLSLVTDELPGTMAAIFQRYADGPMQELRPATRKSYEYFLFGILTHRFGHMLPDEIKPAHIAQYLERRKIEGAPISGNRERAALGSVFEFAMRNGLANLNPCRGSQRNKERPDRTLIDSDDLAAAIERAPAHFARVLKFAYLTGARQTDVMLMPVGAVTPRGLEFAESKTGKPRVIEWSDRLRELVREILEARAGFGTLDHDRLLTTRHGEPLTGWGIQSNMRRLAVSWTFRQIRPKAQTDAGDRNVLGHSGQMRVRYTRREKLKPVW
jgi:integrase